MARYQILYWRYIPLGVKAIDINTMVRENLPARFHEAFQQAAAQSSKSNVSLYTTSGFRWSEEKERDGTAAEVAAAVAKELAETWDNEQSLALFEAKKSGATDQFIDLKKL